MVGVADQLKGQVAMAFVVLKDNAALADAALALKLEGEIMKLVDGQLGAVARPSRVRFVTRAAEDALAASCCGARSRPSAKAATRAT